MLRTPRYRCNECGSGFSYPFMSVLHRKPFTNRIYEQIQARVLKEPYAA